MQLIQQRQARNPQEGPEERQAHAQELIADALIAILAALYDPSRQKP
jgi:hypothetical protein